MATSSIFTSVIIKTEEEAEELIAALEAAEKAPQVSRTISKAEYVTDHDEIRRIMAKRNKYWTNIKYLIFSICLIRQEKKVCRTFSAIFLVHLIQKLKIMQNAALWI